MKKRSTFSSYSLFALLALSALAIGLMARPAASKEDSPRASLKTPHKSPNRTRGKVTEQTAQEEQISGESKIAARSGRVNFTELARRDALAPATPPEIHFVPEPQGEEDEEARERPVPPDATIFRQDSGLLATFQPLGPSPVVSPSFQGVQATGWLPPDTQGAVGPNHLMVAVNGGVLVQSKTGSNVGFVRSLVNFFSPVANGSGDVFDPRIQYDPYGNRWILIAAADRDSAASAILVGASQSSDPTGNWNLYRIDTDSADQSWSDYPMLGFNKDWIVISANMFAITGSSASFYPRFFVLNKANFYAGSSGNYTQISGPNSIGGTIAPASTYDPTLSTLYLIKNWNGNSGGSGFLRLFSITGAVGAEVLNNVSSGIFISTANTWSSSPPSSGGNSDFAPQLGTPNKIQTGDANMQNVIYRNGSLWCVHTIFLPTGAATRSSAQWWQISPASNSVQQLGRIDDASGNLFYAFPSIAVNSTNDVLIGYARFSSAQYAGSGYAYRASTDPANSLRDDTVLKAGAGTYYQADSIGRNRWGDYSGTWVDPVNDTDFWTLQEYAPATDTWATWWGRIGGASNPGPANDNFVSAQIITGNSGSVAGTNINATKEAGEPNPDNNGGASVWYRWQAPNSGTATLTTLGSDFDTLLGVYTGSSVNSLTPIVVNDDDPNGGLTSRVVFSATAGATYQIAVDGYRGASGNITFNWSLGGQPPTSSTTAGLQNPATSGFFLRNSNSAGAANLTFSYGPAGSGWTPIAGDWNGDHVDTPGLYNPSTSTFFLKNTSAGGNADLVFSYGPAGAGWIPVVGDWNGDGVDTVGLYQPSTSNFFLKNTNAAGAADLVFSYGPAGAGWLPLAGDWNGDSVVTVGLYQPSTSTFFLRNSNSAGSANLTFSYGPAGAGWTPLAGDWNQDRTTSVGLYQPTTSTFFLRNTNAAGTADLTFGYGPAGAGWKPLAGDWDGL